MSLQIVTADAIQVGDQMPEADGFLFDVIKVEPSQSGKTIAITLASDFSSHHSHWAVNGGVTQNYRAKTRLYVERAAEIKETPAELGKQAFEAGRPRVPAHDERLMAVLDGKAVGEGIDPLREWLAGWDTANLAAPVAG